MAKPSYDIVVSINIHEKLDFVIKQIQNIQSFLSSTHCVVLNCNQSMFEQCQNHTFPENVYINPEIINKRRFHGTLTKGIVSNMTYAMNNFSFQYFIVLSSRTLFYNILSVDILKRRQQVCNSSREYNMIQRKQQRIESRHPNKYKQWNWPTLIKAKLSQYYLGSGRILFASAHEGLTFSVRVCENILEFLRNNSEIREDIFQFGWCAEEFALQTIAQNEINLKKSREYGYIYIGNKTHTSVGIPTDPNLYVYKVNKDKYDGVL